MSDIEFNLETGSTDFCDCCGVFWMDCDCDCEDEWPMDYEEELIWDGICPECGAELAVCDHGASWFDEDDL